MGKTLVEIAQTLKFSPLEQPKKKQNPNKVEKPKPLEKKVQLIFAFNGTGKTRLSREFKKLISPKIYDEETGEELESGELSNKKVLYYSAFTEDLFYWNNDLAKDLDFKLEIRPNSFTKWILEEQGKQNDIINLFQSYSDKRLNPEFSDDFDEVSFSIATGDDEAKKNVKISKGEESNFIWSIFFSLIDEVIPVLNEPIEKRDTDIFNKLEYIVIDDPVSSLDENHLIQLAVNLAHLIESSKSNLRFVITTHNTLFYNVLFNEIDKKTCYLLRKNEDNTYDLNEKKGDSNSSFSYHLFLKQKVEEAIISESLEKYHFMFLRNLYEKTANFLGYKHWTDIIPKNYDEEQRKLAIRLLNLYSHSTLSNETISDLDTKEIEKAEELFANINKLYTLFG